MVLLQLSIDLAHELGVSLAHEKMHAPVTTLTFCGVELGTRLQ